MPGFEIGFNHQGNFTALPSIFTDINADDLDLHNQGPTGVLALLAAGAGFFPPKVATPLPIDIGSPRRFIDPSDLLTVANYAVKPFPQLDRAVGQVFVVPVTAATQASLTLHSSAPTDLVILRAKPYGFSGNGYTVKSETGKITIAIPGATTTRSEIYSYTSMQDLVTQVIGRSGIVTAVFLVEGTPTNFAATAMTGGTEPNPTNQDWADGLAALNGIRVNVINAASPNSAIWAMVSDYAIQRRSRGIIGGQLRQWNTFSDQQASIQALVAEANGLNAIRMMHVGIGADGLPAYLTAARHAALAAALEPSMPMTNKNLDFQALETRLDPLLVGGVTGLLLNGVAPPIPDAANAGVYIQSRGLSTWVTDANLYRREMSVLAAVDAVQDQIESQMRVVLGGEGTEVTVARAEQIVETVLQQATKRTAAVRILSYRRGSIHASFSSDTVLRVSAAMTPILPVNFGDVSLTLERTEISLDFNVPLALAA